MKTKPSCRRLYQLWETRDRELSGRQKYWSKYVYINQQDAPIYVVRLYFSLDALHILDYISPSSGATFYELYIAFGICRYMPVRLAVVWL